MLSVLISAFACCPNRGSEFGVGWNWVTNLAKYCNVYVITEESQKMLIEEELRECKYGEHLFLYYVSIEERAWKMYHNQGDWRFYYYYNRWQKRVYHLAMDIVANNAIDIIHQLGLICFREPGYLWKIKKIPFVWGPLGGFVEIPMNYLMRMGGEKILYYTLKRSLMLSIAYFSLRVRKSVKRSSLLFAASQNSYNALAGIYRKKAIVMNETGFSLTMSNLERKRGNEALNIVWIGRIIPTKMLDIALETLSKLESDINYVFHIVGDGKEKQSYQEYAKLLNVADKCIWHGMVSHDMVQKIMENSDLLFFTSIVEGTSHVIMEAIANKLPILCYDTCGHGEIVNENIGIKIPMCSPQEDIRIFADKIKYFNSLTRSIYYQDMSFLGQYTWENKAKIMYDYYCNVIPLK